MTSKQLCDVLYSKVMLLVIILPINLSGVKNVIKYYDATKVVLS